MEFVELLANWFRVENEMTKNILIEEQDEVLRLISEEELKEIEESADEFDGFTGIRVVGRVQSEVSNRKLIISVENNTVLFENLNDFTPMEFIGILHNAISTADVLYKTKVMQMVEKAVKNE